MTEFAPQTATMASLQPPTYFQTRHRGDMVGDKLAITSHHLRLAEKLSPYVLGALDHCDGKPVFAVAGPSGVGKSETAALIADMLSDRGMKMYVLSGDNYPKLPPPENDALRARIFAEKGEAGLKEFLLTQNEIDFDRMSQIAADFKCGRPRLELRIMDKAKGQVYRDPIALDASKVDGLVIEATGALLVNNVDLKICLYATPEETAAHRAARKRDDMTGTPLLKAVLDVEQKAIDRMREEYADVVIDRQYGLSFFRKGLYLNAVLQGGVEED